MSIRVAVNLTPDENPNETQQTRDQNRWPPAPTEVDREHNKGRQRAANRRSAVEERGRQRTLLLGKPLRNRLGRSRPVRRLAGSQQKPKNTKAEQSTRKWREHRD